MLPVNQHVFVEVGNLLEEGHKSLRFVHGPQNGAMGSQIVPVTITRVYDTADDRSNETSDTLLLVMGRHTRPGASSERGYGIL